MSEINGNYKRMREEDEENNISEPPSKKANSSEDVMSEDKGTATDPSTVDSDGKQSDPADVATGKEAETDPTEKGGIKERTTDMQEKTLAGKVEKEPESSPAKQEEVRDDKEAETSAEQAEVSIVLDRTGTEVPSAADTQAAAGPVPAATGGVETETAPAPTIAAPAPTALLLGLPPGIVGTAPDPVDPTVQPTVVNPDQIIEERGEVASMYVGRVIGKGGEMIRDLQARSGARIDVDQNVPPGQPRVITYRGTRKTVDFAKKLVHMLSQEGVNEADLPLGEAKREILVIPSQAVGKVIGRGGEMIRELQSRSQAKIQVDHSGVSGVPPDQKQVTITGTEPGVIKAKEMVMFLVANPSMDAMQSLNMLVEEKLRGGEWGSGPPYVNLPNQGVNMQPHMIGQAGYGGGYQPQYPPQGAYGMPPQAAPYQVPQAAYQSGMQPESEVVYAQKQFMGRIIGQKGITINDLQRRSGTDIQINQEVPQGQDCEITIQGPRPGIDMAKQMIREIIEVGPQHPYAGGADSYGGGAPGGYQQQGYGDFSQGYGYQQPYGGGYDHAGYGPPVYGVPPQQYGGYQQQPYDPYAQAAPAPPPQAPPPPAPAASDWKSATAPDGQVYYYNERSGQTQWEKPAGMP